MCITFQKNLCFRIIPLFIVHVIRPYHFHSSRLFSTSFKSSSFESSGALKIAMEETFLSTFPKLSFRNQSTQNSLYSQLLPETNTFCCSINIAS